MTGRLLAAALVATILAAVGAHTSTATPNTLFVQAHPAKAVAAVPSVVRGHGSRVITIRVTRSSPLVVTSRYSGNSNFIVRLVGGSADELLVNEIGSYNGQTAVEDVRTGRYRLAIEADGPWTVSFAQPFPSAAATRIPGTLSGRGARVIQIRARRGMQPVVTASHSGQSNFIVQLIGFGDTSGSMLLFNEIGRYRGETLADSSIPSGHFLLWVEADGAWSIRFTA